MITDLALTNFMFLLYLSILYML